ncbi:MAG TPA: 3'-5' exonuclease, partial [Gemmatimonadaceae bacterium]|nr:3'-5' exonuclease [Gemmatimonadaceae bacterium]
GVFSEALEYYEVMRREAGGGSAPPLEKVIAELGGLEAMERIRRAKSAEERYPTSMQRLRMLSTGTSGAPIQEQVKTLLERVALSGREADTDEHGRANLLTLHATKGLEFSRVYLIGAEDAQFSTENQSREELEESRRVFYVGMTRARDRLVITRALVRNGKPTGGATYLDELGVSRPADPRPPLVAAALSQQGAG